MKRLAAFFSGMLAALLLSALALPALSAPVRTIAVTPGVRVYIDGLPLTYCDAGGQSIAGFLYQDTVYFPLRAICDALDHPIHWNAAARSVHISKR